MAHKVIVPKRIVYGKEALKDAGIYLKEFGKKALIVTDEIMVKIGNVSRLTDILNENNIKYAIYDKVNSEPTRSEEHTSELQSRQYLVCRLLLEKKKTRINLTLAAAHL